MIVVSQPLVAGQQRIQLPQGGPWQQVKLANESQYDLTVQIAGVQEELGAWTANRYAVNGTNFIDVTATALQSVAGAPSAALELTLAGPGELIVGTYPMALARETTVNLAAGSTVVISGTSSVSIAGTPTVNIAAGQSVSITGTATVSISGTPSVSISGTPTVILGGGTASIGAVSAINSTVTVAGTVNIGNTPAVSISGTVTVSISSGTVSIAGTPNINISGQSITVGVNLPWANVGTKTPAGTGADGFDTSAVATGTQTLGLSVVGAITRLVVKGNQSGTLYENATGTQPLVGWITVPVNGQLDSTYHVSWSSSGPVAAPDSVNESIAPLGGPPLNGEVMVSASFKPNTVIARVGSAGAFTTGTNVQVTPPFGQATTAGNLLIAWVSASGNPPPDITTAAAGWVQGVDIFNGAQEVAIWYKPNCGAAEAAPVFTAATGSNTMYAQVAEFSGALAASPLDSTGAIAPNSTATSMAVANLAPDTQLGDLFVTASRWPMTNQNTATFADACNNGAVVQVGNTGGGAAVLRHASFTYTIIPATATVVTAFASALAMGYPALGQNTMAESVPVVIASDQAPALWQAPNKPPISKFQVGVGTLIVVPGVPGQTIRVFAVIFQVAAASAGGNCNLEDTNGGLITQTRNDSIGNVPIPLFGAPLPIGLGAQIRVQGGGNVQAQVVYSQA